MSQHNIDTVLRVRVEHRAGQLARLLGTIAAEDALIGDISTVRVAETATVRDIVVETTDEEHTRRVIEALRRVEGIDVLAATDRVFDIHRGGKIHSTSTVALNDFRDMRAIYTPGVARVSLAIQRDPAVAWEMTNIGNSVGVFTNGSRVLGLGDIGPLASMPVMEGKAVLYDRFSGISATPILIDTPDVRTFVDTVVLVSRTFGGIHLEDISSPECFQIESELMARLDKPVMHDDQHGTAVVTLAAIINACRMTGRELKRSRMGQIGLGAAGSAIARLALAYGLGEVLVTDISEEARAMLAREGALPVELPELMRQADIVVATTGRPGLIRPEMVHAGQVIFALSNPNAEIVPQVARDAGAAFAGDGRSINNALAFPGIFRGALRARSKAIRPEMMIAAAEAIAAMAEPGEVVPSPLNLAVHEAVAKAVEAKADELGLRGTARL
jgi:malate dehydrogenase (oxaloacetate-decarboxylating)